MKSLLIASMLLAPTSVCNQGTFFQARHTPVEKVAYNRNYVEPAPIQQPIYDKPTVVFDGLRKPGTMRMHISDPQGNVGDRVIVLRTDKKICIVPEVK